MSEGPILTLDLGSTLLTPISKQSNGQGELQT